MKILFVDFDGVVNKNCFSDEYWANLILPFKKDNGRIVNTDWHTNCLYWFLKILSYCQKNKIKIVVSSSWRTLLNTKEFNDNFLIYFPEIKHNIIKDCTGKCCSERGLEILNYINSHNVEDYLVIDDMLDEITKHIPKDNFIWIDGENGLVEEDCKKILDRLSKM